MDFQTVDSGAPTRDLTVLSPIRYIRGFEGFRPSLLIEAANPVDIKGIRS